MTNQDYTVNKSAKHAWMRVSYRCVQLVAPSLVERELVVTVSVMAATAAAATAALLMRGRERGREEGETRESVREPPAKRAWWCMASSRTVRRLLQILISFSASSALRMACLVSCSC